MESTDMLDCAALLVSYLPAADAEQLLQRLPDAAAVTIRQRAGAGQMPKDQGLATARQFIRELFELRERERGTRHRIDSAQGPAAFHFLARLLPARLAHILMNEMPPATAAVLSILPPSRAADVLTLLPEDYQQHVVHHMLCSAPVSPEILHDLAESLADMVAREPAAACGNCQGPERLAELLRFTDATTRQRLAEVARRDGVELTSQESPAGVKATH